MFKSIESFKSALPHFLGCRRNYTSQTSSVTSPVKIRLWLYYIWHARKSYLQMLDPIHNQGLRLAVGAFRTSPVASLYVEADEPSLYSRREKLSLQYAIRLAANPSNPAHEVTFPPNYTMHNKFSNCFVWVSPSTSDLEFQLRLWRYKHQSSDKIFHFKKYRITKRRGRAKVTFNFKTSG